MNKTKELSEKLYVASGEVIELLRLFAQQITGAYKADNYREEFKTTALTENAVATLIAVRASLAGDENGYADPDPAALARSGAKLTELLAAMRDGLEEIELHAADRCYGLLSAIEAYARAEALLSVQPLGEEPIASPGLATQGAQASDAYSDFCCDVSYRMSEAAFQAKAARALLRENPKVEEDEGLTGVSFLLSRIAEDLGALALEVSNSEFSYTLSARESAEAAAA
jgi:hypothetical protein